jgi:ABC-2 type transport system permease protein
MRSAPAARRERCAIRTIATLVRRDFQIARTYWFALFLDLFYVIANLIVFFYISRTLGGPTGTDLSGAPTYFSYAAVGVVIAVVTGSASQTVAIRIQEEKMAGGLEALLIQPIRSFQLAFGIVGFPFLFGIVRAVFYMFIAAAVMGLDTSNASWGAFVSMLVLAGTTFAAIGIACAAAVFIFSRGAALIGIAVFVLDVLGGAVFPPELFPGWMGPIVEIVPTRFIFEGSRTALFSGTGWTDDAGALALITAIGLPLALGLFAQALRHSLRRGTIGKY